MRLSVAGVLVLAAVALPAGEALAQSTGVIAGMVTEGSDCPRQGVRITVVDRVGGEITRHGVSDGDGRFRIDGLPEGVYEVFPDLDAFRERKRRRVEVKGSGSVDFKLDHVLYGAVTLDGTRSGGMTVFAELASGEAGACQIASARSETTREDGTYIITRLPAGTYRVSIDQEPMDELVTLEKRMWRSHEIALVSSSPTPRDPARVIETTWAK